MSMEILWNTAWSMVARWWRRAGKLERFALVISIALILMVGFFLLYLGMAFIMIYYLIKTGQFVD